jgi:hypothetical protein
MFLNSVTTHKFQVSALRGVSVAPTSVSHGRHVGVNMVGN